MANASPNLSVPKKRVEKTVLSHGFEKSCRVQIPRNKVLDRIVLMRPARRIQRSCSVHHLQTISPPSNSLRVSSTPPPKPTQMDMPKIRSILKIPSDKPRTLFGRRKSTNDRVMFSFPAQDGDGNNNGKNDQQFNSAFKTNTFENAGPSNYKSDQLLIDFSGDEHRQSDDTAHSNVAIENLHPPKQYEKTSNNQNIIGVFDPVMLDLQTPLIPSAVSASDTNHVSLLNDLDWSIVQIQSGSTASKPVPGLIPIAMVSQHTSRENMPSTSNCNDNRSKKVLRRPMPGMIHFKSISRQEIRSALEVVKPTENILVNESSNNECLEMNTDDEHFGKLHYDSDSDSN